MKFDYDILIVGGGAVGLTLACALRDPRLKVGLIAAHHTVDRRVSAITRASQHIFESLGVWEDIFAQGVSPYQKMQVWEANGGPSLAFDCDELGETNLGYIIENRVIQSAVGATHASPNVTSIDASNTDWKILSARLIIGADGANSQVREHADIPLNTQDYGQHALVATVHTELPHQMTARQIFLPSGPLAFLPLLDPHTCSIVWSTAPAHAKALLEMEPEAFKTILSEAFEHRLGAINGISERVTFPLCMRHARQYVKPGIALVGDAAHTIHPLAGQGMNLGLLDAACLAEVLLEAVDKNRDIASLSTLRRYERWRRGHNTAMIAAMQGFLMPVLRQPGLHLAHHLPVMRRVLMRHAMGLAGDLPRLAQPIFT
jgi:2-polyprenylphenol 6-hydroxylase